METTRCRLLVTLDGSDLSNAAIPVAARLARELDGQVTLLQVVPPLQQMAHASMGDLPPMIDLEERRAAEDLRAHEGAFGGAPVERVVLVGSHPAEEIIGWLRSHPVDLVVMATHGRGGLRHLVAGSVTEAVLRSGLAPVVAVRPVQVAEPAPSRH